MNPQNVQTDKRGTSRRPAVDVRRDVTQQEGDRSQPGQQSTGHQRVGGAEIAQKWARYLAVRDERSHRDLLHAADRFIRSETRRMLVSHAHLAEEAAQETLLGVERKIASLEPPEYPAAYIRRTLSNRMATLLHRESRRRARELTSWNPDDEITVADVATMSEWYDFLETLRGAVTDDEFWTLILRHHFDFSYDEIGELLDKGSGAIRQIALRGRRKACERMSRLEGRVPAWLQIGGIDSPIARRQQPADPVDGQRRPSTGSAAAGGFLQSGRRWLLDGPSPIMPLVVLLAVPLLFQTRQQPVSAEMREQPAATTNPYGPIAPSDSTGLTTPSAPSFPATRSDPAGFINPFVASLIASTDSVPPAGPSITEAEAVVEPTPSADRTAQIPPTTVASATSIVTTPPTSTPPTSTAQTPTAQTATAPTPTATALATSAVPTSAITIGTTAPATTTATTTTPPSTTATTVASATSEPPATTTSVTAQTTTEPSTTTAGPNTSTSINISTTATNATTSSTAATAPTTTSSTTESSTTTSSRSRRPTTSNPGTEPPIDN